MTANNLENQAPADTFKALLQTGNNDGITGGVTPVQDGRGEDTALALSTNSARINGPLQVTGNSSVDGDQNVTGDSSVDGDLTVTGDFTVNGLTTTINTQTLEIEDQTLVIASNVSHTALNQPSGILWGNDQDPPKLTYQEGEGFNFSGGDLLKEGTLYGISQLAVAVSNSEFLIDGVSKKTLNLQRGITYRFDQSDLSNANHPLKFSTVSDGIHAAGGAEFTSGVITQGTPGQDGAYTQITISPQTPNLYYYCGNHSGMGGDALGSITIEANGSVGIGTTSPTRTLHIVDATNDGSGGIKVQNYKPVVELSDATANATATTLTQNDTKFTIANNSVDSLTIDSAGDVGIGTTSPDAKLHIEHETSVSILRLSTATSSGYAQVKGGGTTGSFTIEADPTDSVAGSIIAFKSDGEDRMRIDSNGNVGIGTTDPKGKLELNNGSSAVELQFKETSTAFHRLGIRKEGPLLQLGEFENAGNTFTSILTVDADGNNVGIGTTNPSAKLDVSDDTATDNAWSVLAKFRPNINDGPAETGIHIQSYPSSSNVEDRKTGIQSVDAAGVRPLLLNKDGGNVGIGTVSPSAPLEVSSTTGGVIMPRMNTTEMEAINNPTDGEMIYNTTDNKFYGRANGSWVQLH